MIDKAKQNLSKWKDKIEYTVSDNKQISSLDNKYDIVIGPIADDDMALLFRQYENGMITFENMLSGMIYKKTTNQYSFHTEKAIALLKKVGV